jgi:hypothetical protein
MQSCTRLSAALCLAGALAISPGAHAHPDAAPLRFADFFKRPIGPRGLEPTDTLMALSGSRVRLTGFVAQGHGEVPLILAPLPATLPDEHEALADDLPPSIAHVHGDQGAVRDASKRCNNGPIEVTGMLSTGPVNEADGRISFVRIHAEAARCDARVPSQR